jgi:hypothetical protein
MEDFNMQDIAQEVRCDNLVTPQVVGAATVNTNTGMYRSMAKYRKGLVIITATLTNGKTCIAQLTCSSAATAANKANISGKTVTLTGSLGALNQVGVIEFDVNDLTANDEDTYFVGVDLTGNQAGDAGAAVLIRSAARYYTGSSMPA